MNLGPRLRALFKTAANAISNAFLIERSPPQAPDIHLSALVGQTITSDAFEHPVFKKLAEIVALTVTTTAKGNIEISITKGHGAVAKNSGPFQCGETRDSLSLGWGHDETSILHNMIAQRHMAIGVYTFSEDRKKTGITVYELLGQNFNVLQRTGHYDLIKNKFTPEKGFEFHAEAAILIHTGM